MKEFFKFSKVFILFTSPLWVLMLLYFICDPFYILRNHGDYSENYGKSFNRDRISTQVFLNNEETAQYRSFIFGNSKTSSFQTKEWGKYIGDSLAFHFDASNEFVSGIKDKIVFLDKRNTKIENALVVLDAGSFQYPIDTTGTIFIKDPRVSPSVSNFQFHLTFIKSFFKDAYFVRYFDFKIFKSFRNYMLGMLENRNIKYLPKRNDFIFDSYEKELAKGEDNYYNVLHPDAFYERDSISKPKISVIKAYQIEFLKEMKVVFDKQKTNYKIVLDPSYSQIEWSDEDLTKINAVFGKERVFNFAGKNDLTNDKRNFYEIYHYRPFIGAKMLNKIYTP